jgi:hypothetical protein
VVPERALRPSGVTTPLLEILSKKIIPLVQRDGARRLVIARDSRNELQLRPGVGVTKGKLPGPKLTVRGPRQYENLSLITARWPDDGLHSLRIPHLSCIFGGAADLRFRDYQLHCEKGTLLFIPPGVAHQDGSRSHLEGDNRRTGWCEILTLALCGQQVQAWTCYSRQEEHLGLKPGENIFVRSPQAAGLLMALSEEVQTEEQDCDAICDGLLKSFLLTLRRDIAAGRFLHLHESEIQENRRGGLIPDNLRPELCALASARKPIAGTSRAVSVHVALAIRPFVPRAEQPNASANYCRSRPATRCWAVGM